MTGNAGEIQGTATLASAPLIKEGGTEMMTGILDFAVADDAATSLFERIVSIAPSKGSLVATSGIANEPFNRLYESCGFACLALEVAMVHPFSDRAKSAVAHPPSRWYTATESLIGI